MDNNKNPLVSVLICTYNRANLIKRAILSAIDQDYNNLEIIIIDDASTDNTKEIIDSIKSERVIKYYKNNRNLNIALSRNESIKYSSGKYLAILDSDDYWIEKNKIKNQVDFLEKNKDIALVGTNAVIVDYDSNKIGSIENFLSNEDIHERLLVSNQFVHSSVMYRKITVIENMCFLDKTSPFEDYDLILRIGRKNKVSNLREFSVAYTNHENGASKKIKTIDRLILLWILLKNSPFYPNLFRAINRRLGIIS